MAHYNLHSRTDRYAAFTSRWGEFLLVNRKSLRSFYNQSGEGGGDGTERDADLFDKLSDRPDLYDSLASDYVTCGGEDSPLTADVLATLADLDSDRSTFASDTRRGELSDDLGESPDW